MQAATVNLIRYFSPLRLMGPLSDKELRVASRRVRSYALRSGYIILLCILMLSAWYSLVGLSNRNMAAFGVSRASTMSMYVAARIIWFQFAAAQLVAAVMMSLSITDEMRRGTLGILLTTPITSVHIVLGKMLTGLLQTALLLAISLPVLAVLRLQGGISWDFVLAGFCITLTASVFAAALCLLLSTRFHHPYQVISAGAVVYLIAFVILPMIVALLTRARGGGVPRPGTWSFLDLMSPFYALYRVDPQMVSARPGTVGSFPWPVHCLILAATATLMLCISMWCIRRVAAGASSVGSEVFTPIKRLWGSPVAWKDARDRPWHRRRGDVVLTVAILGLCCLLIVVKGRAVQHLYYLDAAFWLIVLLRLAISAAGGITREKESGAWPILLTTPLEDKQILRTKAMTALRHNALVILAGLAIHVGFLISAGIFAARDLELLYAVMSPLSRVISALFVLCAGLYFGVRMRTTTMAAAAAFGTHLCLSYLVGGWLVGMVVRLLWNPNRASGGLQVLYILSFSMGMGMVLLNVALSVILLRRARHNLRRCIF